MREDRDQSRVCDTAIGRDTKSFPQDLLSINYVHLGAGKMWYCIPPSARAKFEEVCRNMYPKLYEACPAFLRHKDIMISPSQLRQWGIPFVTAHQQAGEFIVLNAAAYHW